MQAGASEQTPRVPPDRRDRQWHATSTADAFSALDSRASGLAESEALAHWCTTQGLKAQALHLVGYGDEEEPAGAAA